MRSRNGKPDICLFVIVMFLVIFGLVVLYSSSAYNGQVRFDDPAYYFKKQLFATVLGLMAMAGIASVDYHILSRHIFFRCFCPGQFFSLGMLITVPEGGFPSVPCPFSLQSTQSRR